MKPDKANKLIAAAVELCGKNGVDQTPAQAISKHAGIGNATLFKYFSSKDELIRQAYLATKLEMVAATKEGFVPSDDFEALLRHVWMSLFQWAVEHPFKFKFTMQLKSSRYLDADIERQIDQEFLFFKVAMHSAKASGQLIDEPDELIFALMASFLEIAITFKNLPIATVSEATIYERMLASLGIRKYEASA